MTSAQRLAVRLTSSERMTISRKPASLLAISASALIIAAEKSLMSQIQPRLYKHLMPAVGTTDLLFAAGLTVLAGGPALAQMPAMGDAATHTLHRPFDVETFGVFRNI